MKMMFRRYCVAFTIAAVFSLTACAPRITVTALGADKAELAFEAGFSRATEQTLKSIMGAVAGGANADAPLVTADDMSTIMRRAGLQDVTASAEGTNVATRGTIPRVSQSALAAAGILGLSQNSLTLTLGSAQLQALYALLDEETQAYFDLLMIPALSDETLSPAEYAELLASVYGPALAKELTESPCVITLAAPNGKKTSTARLTLGELLTLTAERRWSVNW